MDIALFSSLWFGGAALLAAGWLYVAVVVAVILFGLVFSATSDDGAAVWLLILPFLIIPWTLGTNPFVWLWLNPHVAIVFAAQYLAVGLAYVAFRWWKLSLDSGRDILDNKALYLERYHASGYSTTFGDYLEECNVIPTVAKSKAKLTIWLVWWPFNAPSFLFRNFFKLVGDFLQHFFGNFFTAIRDRTYKSIGIDKVLLETKIPEKE